MQITQLTSHTLLTNLITVVSGTPLYEMKLITLAVIDSIG